MELTGNTRMQERPIGPLVDCLRSQGARIEYVKTEGCLPVRVYGGGLTGGSVRIESSVSSQFTSAVLMVSPFAAAPVRLTLSEDAPTSLPYIHMTLDNMRQFGVSVDAPSPNVFDVGTGGYTCVSGRYSVEPDASSATYAAALAAISGATVTLAGVTSTSTQGGLHRNCAQICVSVFTLCARCLHR